MKSHFKLSSDSDINIDFRFRSKVIYIFMYKQVFEFYFQNCCQLISKKYLNNEIHVLKSSQ